MTAIYPEYLLKAAEYDFGTNLSGFLLDVRDLEEGVCGVLFYDSCQEHSDGTTITTESILELYLHHGFEIILTSARRRYVVVSRMLMIEMNGVTTIYRMVGSS